MRVVEDPSGPISGVERSAVTIGAYDGVHLGHRAVLHAVCEEADRLDGTSAVVTFDRHPAQVVRPESAPRLLCDLDQKLELLDDAGVDLAVVLTFDEARAAESAEDFVRTVLVEAMSVRSVIVGEDFHFGHRRQGNVALLQEMGGEFGFRVRGHHLVGPDGRDARDEQQVSSTAIRRALVEGRLDDANSMLGREHEMRGTVVEGDRRGREIGFPTANVAIPDWMLVPADGIYAGWMVERSGRRRTIPAAIYIGHRPTFYDDSAATVLEVHGLGDVGDVYGERVAVRFANRIRGDQRFDSVDELAVQLRADCEEARRLLA